MRSFKSQVSIVCLIVAIEVSAPAFASAQSLTEFIIPSPQSNPVAIAPGSDGALWFTENQQNKIGRVAVDGTITEFNIPSPQSGPVGIAPGPDGALWFTEQQQNKIGRITTAGAITEFNIPSPQSNPQIIVAGSDGAMWFAEYNQNKIGRITTAGAITEFAVPSPQAGPQYVAAGLDGALWFTEFQQNKIGRITTDGAVTEFTIPSPQSGPGGIVGGPDGALWFTEFQQNKIGRITTSGTFQEYTIPSPQSAPVAIAAGPDGALWFTERQQNKIGRITVNGTITEFTVTAPQSSPDGIVAGPDGAIWFTEFQQNNIGRLIPIAATSTLFAATLPSSRSVQVSNSATAFATIINSGPAATGCGISPITMPPANFSYQTTDPNTNALTGTPNTPVAIASGGIQTYVVAFLANSPFPSTNVVLGFSCFNSVASVVPIVGVNTLQLTFDANPIPDIVALAATATHDGILHITGNTGSGAFAVASVNVGASSSITVKADTGNATLPIALTLCRTNPQGQCAAPPTPSVTATFAANDTPTFSIFGTAGAAIANSPGVNRIFVRFSDAGGIVRGSTSVAVLTQ